MNRPKFTIITLSVIIILLIILRVYLLAELAALNVIHAVYLDELQGLRRTNAILSSKIFNASSLKTIEEKAIKSGFIQYENIYYIR